MKILLINPYEADQDGYSSPPLGLAYIAGTLEKFKYDIKIVDGYLVGQKGIEESIIEYKPEIVGITCYTPGRKKSIEIARIAKEINKNIITVIGGAHATIMGEQIMNNYSFVDICVYGEGEQTMLEIAQKNNIRSIDGIYWRYNNKVIKNKSRHFIDNLDNIPFPSWHLIDMNRYPPIGHEVIDGVDISSVPRIPVIFSRGCTGSCNFCSTWWVWKGHRTRSVDNMISELKILVEDKGFKHICFYDDSFSSDIEKAKQLCKKIVSHGLKFVWSATTRTDCVDNELLELMKMAGCYEIAYGIESASDTVLKKMKKMANVKDGIAAIKLAKKHKIKTRVMIIIGNDGETKKTINETVAFLRKTKPDILSYVGNLWVLPGTALYQKLKKINLINDDFWLGNEPYFVYPLHSKEDMAKYTFAISNRIRIGSLRFFLKYYSPCNIIKNKIKLLLK